MRKVGSVFAVLALVAMVWPVMAEEEEGPLARVYFVKPKAGMGKHFEEAFGKHSDWHRKQNDDWAWHTWQMETGNRLDYYVVASIGHHWKDFDGRSEMDKADLENYFETVGPYVDTVEGIIAAHHPEISMPLTEEGITPLHGLLSFHLNMGERNDFFQTISKVHEAIKKTDWPTNYLWYELVSGDEHPTFYLIFPKENWAGFTPPEMNFEEMLKKAYGQQEAGEILAMFKKTVHCQTSEIRSYRPDLSYLPAAQ